LSTIAPSSLGHFIPYRQTSNNRKMSFQQLYDFASTVAAVAPSLSNTLLGFVSSVAKVFTPQQILDLLVGIPDDTPVLTDPMFFSDGGAHINKATLQIMLNLLNSVSADTPALGDNVFFGDAGIAIDRCTLQTLFNAMNTLADMGTIVPASDHVVVDDAGTLVKMDVDDFLGNAIAQVGVTVVDSADEAGFCDVSASDTYKQQRVDLYHAFERKFKNADQTYTGDTTLSNDNDLQATLVTSGQYEISFFLNITSGATPDFKFDFAGGTATFTDIKIAWFQHDVGNTGNATAIATVHTIAASVWPKYVIVKIGCTVNAGGTFILRHAQNTSDGVTTGLLRSSWMEIKRVA
jgi:hypothetical protein